MRADRGAEEWQVVTQKAQRAEAWVKRVVFTADIQKGRGAQIQRRAAL